MYVDFGGHRKENKETFVMFFFVIFQVFVNGDFHKSVMSSACTKVFILSACRGVEFDSRGSCATFFSLPTHSAVCFGEPEPPGPRAYQCPDSGLQRPHFRGRPRRLQDSRPHRQPLTVSLITAKVQICFEHFEVEVLGIDTTFIFIISMMTF